ncbi:hypothetical protein KIPB_017068, partial [Kipferlia bialata]
SFLPQVFCSRRGLLSHAIHSLCLPKEELVKRTRCDMQFGLSRFDRVSILLSHNPHVLSMLGDPKIVSEA